jgi:hypothetical protein
MSDGVAFESFAGYTLPLDRWVVTEVTERRRVGERMRGYAATALAFFATSS